MPKNGKVNSPKETGGTLAGDPFFQSLSGEGGKNYQSTGKQKTSLPSQDESKSRLVDHQLLTSSKGYSEKRGGGV